jgi:hypothetical protein
LAEDAPATFSIAQAAKDWMKREGKEAVNGGIPLIRYNISGSPPLNPVRVRLRLQGQRGPRPTPALVVLPGDPRAMAEAQLGPLAGFEIVTDAARPDLLEVTTREAPAPIVAASGAVAMPLPQRKLVIMPDEEQIDSEIVRDFLRQRAQAMAAHKARGLEHRAQAAGISRLEKGPGKFYRDFARALPQDCPQIRA